MKKLKYKTMEKGKYGKVILSDKERTWLLRHFKHTRNEDILARLGISASTLYRIVRELGLGKSPQHLKKCQEHAARKARESHLANGTYPPKGYVIPGSENYRFKPGESNKDRMGKEAFKEMHRRIGESRKETLKKEKRRVLFGLEQKTGLRVIQCPKEKISLRNNLRKHGYEIARASNEAFITAATHRSEVMERRAMTMGISFHI